jgi:hypothetical protein
MEWNEHSFISIQPLGQFSRNQNPVRRPVWLWHTASWASEMNISRYKYDVTYYKFLPQNLAQNKFKKLHVLY